MSHRKPPGYASALTLATSLLALSSCVSSGAMTMLQDFRVTAQTRVAIMPSDDPAGFIPVLENELIAAGFDVAPAEAAQSGIDSQQSTRVVDDSTGTTSTTQSSSSTALRLPARIAVSLSYSFTEYPAAIYYTRAFIRVIDVSDQRVLASYRADGSQMRPLNMDSVIASFVQELTTLRR